MILGLCGAFRVEILRGPWHRAAYEEDLTQEPAGWTLHSQTPGNQCDTGLGYQSLHPAITEQQGAALTISVSGGRCSEVP